MEEKFDLVAWMAVYEKYPVNTLLRKCKEHGMNENQAKWAVEDALRDGLIVQSGVSTQGTPLFSRDEIAFSTRNQDKHRPKNPDTATNSSGFFNPDAKKFWR